MNLIKPSKYLDPYLEKMKLIKNIDDALHNKNVDDKLVRAYIWKAFYNGITKIENFKVTLKKNSERDTYELVYGDIAFYFNSAKKEPWDQLIAQIMRLSFDEVFFTEPHYNESK